METCASCKAQCLIMTENICAGCYWDEDSKRKAARRADPKWVFNRAYSFAKVVLGQSHEEALISAAASVNARTTLK